MFLNKYNKLQHLKGFQDSGCTIIPTMPQVAPTAAVSTSLISRKLSNFLILLLVMVWWFQPQLRPCSLALIPPLPSPVRWDGQRITHRWTISFSSNTGIVPHLQLLCDTSESYRWKALARCCKYMVSNEKTGTANWFWIVHLGVAEDVHSAVNIYCLPSWLSAHWQQILYQIMNSFHNTLFAHFI